MFARPNRGVRFRVFVQPPVSEEFSTPETVSLPLALGSVGPGPSDDRFYTILPAVDKKPYDPPHTLPPYDGPHLAPARPDRAGHFDSIPEDTPMFRSAHVFACARMTLTIWENYLGQRIPWVFHFPKMELVPRVDWTNAHSGYGFIELGHSAKRSDGIRVPYWQNFDVIAHEVGHAILFSLIPLARGLEPSRDYRAFHETGSDLIAILSAMHSERLLKYVLDKTKGNIYGYNELNRLGELSPSEQVRVACNDKRVPEVLDAEKVHIYSMPMTGALFDIMALRYLRQLQCRKIIPDTIIEQLLDTEHVADAFPQLQVVFEQRYAIDPTQFMLALCHARDYLGVLLANTFPLLNVSTLNYVNIANAVLAVNHRIFSGFDEAELADIFLWRGIGSEYEANRHRHLAM